MTQDRHDFCKGWMAFSCLMLCMLLFFKTPDGDHLFYKLLGLFGISPGIHVSHSSTLYIYMLIPLALAAASIKMALTYWAGYGTRFHAYPTPLRFLPALLFVLVCLTSLGLDHLYYNIIGQRDGLQAVTYHAGTDENLRFQASQDAVAYSYRLTFENHGDHTAAFRVKLTSKYNDTPLLPAQGLFLQDAEGNDRIFTLPPGQGRMFTDEFVRENMSQSEGGGSGAFTVVLVADQEEYIPKPISDSHGTAAYRY